MKLPMLSDPVIKGSSGRLAALYQLGQAGVKASRKAICTHWEEVQDNKNTREWECDFTRVVGTGESNNVHNACDLAFADALALLRGNQPPDHVNDCMAQRYSQTGCKGTCEVK
jgi:hypothetical protein